MTRIKRLEVARRGALKAMVPHAHALAASYARPNGDGEPRPAHMLIATQLRRFADLIDAIATKGTVRMLALFFDGPAGQ